MANLRVELAIREITFGPNSVSLEWGACRRARRLLRSDGLAFFSGFAGASTYMSAKSSSPAYQRHPPRADLAAFAVGQLDELRSSVVEKHLEQCEQCGVVVSEAPGDRFVHRLIEAERQYAGRPERSMAAHKSEKENDGLTLDPRRLPAELRDHPRYEIHEILATGGMSTVYLGRHKVTKSLVAIKTIKQGSRAHAEPISRLLREARMAAQLRHENVARVLDAGKLGEHVFLAMEYIRGETLAEWVTTRGPLSVDQACRVTRQIAVGLQHACDHGIVHRDIKPQNVMITSESGTARILDFGLGRLLDEQRHRSRITRESQILGTPQYMAPEQAANSKVADTRSDIYSLGCTLYFALIGRPPFEASNAVELFAKHAREAPPSLRSRRRDAPAWLVNLLTRMLSKDPQARPQTPDEIVEEVDRNRSRNRGLPLPRTFRNQRSWLGREFDRVTRADTKWLWPAVVLPLVTAAASLLIYLYLRWV